MRVFSIYLATNVVNGKQYIGYDSAWPRRQRSHLASSRSNADKTYKQHFHNAIRKYGEYSFTWEVIYQSTDGQHTLSVMEPHFIEVYGTFVGNGGYNLTSGGEGQKNRAMSVETRRKKSKALIGRPTFQSKSITTPIGIYPGLAMAVRATGACRTAILYRINSSNSKFVGWYYTESPKTNKSLPSRRLGMSKEIVTPLGLFASIQECSRQLNLAISTVQCRVLSQTGFPDWQFTGNTSKQGLVKILTPLGQFDSIHQAALAHSVSTSTIWARLRSKHATEWVRI
jgi:group I intron endonuclease